MATTTYQGNPCKRKHDGVRYLSNGQCVACQVDYRNSAKYKASEAAPERQSAARKRRRGWAPGEHERPFVTACACCGSSDSRHKMGWAADHDHTTGIFRAYLCYPCNIRIGHAEKYGIETSQIEKAYLAMQPDLPERARRVLSAWTEQHYLPPDLAETLRRKAIA